MENISYKVDESMSIKKINNDNDDDDDVNNEMLTNDEQLSNRLINTKNIISNIDIKNIIILFINNIIHEGNINQYNNYNYNIINDVHKKNNCVGYENKFENTLSYYSNDKNNYKNEWVPFAYKINNFNKIKCICSKDNLKRIYYIQNLYNGNILIVGSDCIKKFCGDSLIQFIKNNESNIKKIFKKCEKCNVDNYVSDIVDNICKICYSENNNNTLEKNNKIVSKVCLSCYKIKKINYYKHRCDKCTFECKQIISFDINLDTREYDIFECRCCKSLVKSECSNLINYFCVKCYNALILACIKCNNIYRKDISYNCECIDKKSVNYIQIYDINNIFEFEKVYGNMIHINNIAINICTNYHYINYDVKSKNTYINIRIDKNNEKYINNLHNNMVDICKKYNGDLKVENIYFYSRHEVMYLKAKIFDNVTISKFKDKYKLSDLNNNSLCMVLLFVDNIYIFQNKKLYPQLFVGNILLFD